MKEKIYSIGIIGFGRFGRLLDEILKKDFKIVIYTKSAPKLRQVGASGQTKSKGTEVRYGSLKEVASCKVIILAVPISAIEEVVKRIHPFLKKDALVVDVCSVKKYPVEIMKKFLPKNVEILATHPMFGPTSFKGGLKGKKIVIWPVRIKKEKYRKIRKLLKSKELKVIEITPDEHDRLTARTQTLSHFIARILEIMKIKETKIDTQNFQKLLELKKAVSEDSWELSRDIIKFNPYAKKMRQGFKKALHKIEKMIER